jgi:hypothetical protein
MNRTPICKLSVTGLLSVAMAAASLAVPTTVEAKPTRTSVNNNASSNRSANVNSNKNVNANRNTNVNSNKNVNVNSNKNVNVNSSRHVDVDVDVDNHHHPIGTAVAVGATVAVTAAVIGSMTTTLPPACRVVVVNGVGYQQCGSTWYQPQYVGSSVQYVVIAPLY